jgi:hypothetical protein
MAKVTMLKCVDLKVDIPDLKAVKISTPLLFIENATKVMPPYPDAQRRKLIAVYIQCMKATHKLINECADVSPLKITCYSENAIRVLILQRTGETQFVTRL